MASSSTSVISVNVATSQANCAAVGLGPIPPGSSGDDAVRACKTPQDRQYWASPARSHRPTTPSQRARHFGQQTDRQVARHAQRPGALVAQADRRRRRARMRRANPSGGWRRCGWMDILEPHARSSASSHPGPYMSIPFDPTRFLAILLQAAPLLWPVPAAAVSESPFAG